MLDDELTLLDGTEVVTVGAAARLADQDYWVAHNHITQRLQCEAVLDGVRYYGRDRALTLIAGVQ